MSSPDLTRDLLERMLTEVEILQSIYPDSITTSPVAPLQNALEACTSNPDLDLGSFLPGLAPLSLSLTLHQGFPPPSLALTLPHGYPEAIPEVRWKDGGGRSKEVKEGVMARLQEVSQQHQGQEHLLALAQEFFEMMGDDQPPEEGGQGEGEEKQEADHVYCDNGEEEVEEAQGPSRGKVLARCLVWSHHIINKTKRETIVRGALDLQLGGYSKIGWPGVIVVEGEEDDVKEYVRNLKRLRWQQLLVRGEETEVVDDIDQSRKLPRGFQELGESGMSTLAAAMKEAGLEELFRTITR